MIMRLKPNVSVLVLFALVLVLTGSVSWATPGPPLLGAMAPIIIPTLLTWYLIIVLINSRAIIDILAAFFLTRPKKEGTQISLHAVVIGWAVVLVIAYALIRSGLIKNITDALQQSSAFLTQITNWKPKTNQTQSVPIASPTTIIAYYYTILMFGAISIASFVLLFLGFRSAYRESHEKGPIENPVELRKEVLGFIQEAMTEMDSNEKYHEVIVKCYKQMCKMLSDNGFKIGSAQTAREFSASISGKLRLGEESVDGLTLLFEEARYSDHTIDDDKRTLAVTELSSLSRALVMDVEMP
jgi:hypothetical protein